MQVYSMKYILIADDEPLNREIFSELLEDYYELQIVEDGKACIASIENRKPDLILLDLSMPVIDGLEVCRYIRASQELQDIPVIMVTGHASKESEIESLEAGATEFCSKPFDITTFRDKVAEILAS